MNNTWLPVVMVLVPILAFVALEGGVCWAADLCERLFRRWRSRP